MTPFRFEAEVRLLRWGESSSAGRTITLELPPDAGEAHPFRGFSTGHNHGQRFRMQFNVIADDETVSPAGNPQPQHQERAIVSAERTGKSTLPRKPAGDPARERRPWETLPASQKAGILCADRAFQKWVSGKIGLRPDECTEEDAAYWLRTSLGIESRRELSISPTLAAALDNIRSEFMQWAGRVPEVR